MAENNEDDLFEEAKQKKQSIKMKDVAKMNEKVPASEVLYQENFDLNKILGEKSKKIEVIELDEEEQEEEDEEDDIANEKIIAQLKTLGIEKDVSIQATITKVQNKSMLHSNINKLEDNDISKYIGGEEDDSRDYRFD